MFLTIVEYKFNLIYININSIIVYKYLNIIYSNARVKVVKNLKKFWGRACNLPKYFYLHELILFVIVIFCVIISLAHNAWYTHLFRVVAIECLLLTRFFAFKFFDFCLWECSTYRSCFLMKKLRLHFLHHACRLSHGTCLTS